MKTEDIYCHHLMHTDSIQNKLPGVTRIFVFFPGEAEAVNIVKKMHTVTSSSVTYVCNTSVFYNLLKSWTSYVLIFEMEMQSCKLA